MRCRTFTAKNLLVKKSEHSDENKGFVYVNVYTALGAIPIDDADVSVYTWSEEDGRKLVNTVHTNSSGKAPPIELPVLLDQGTTNSDQRTEYHLVVKADNYHTTIIINVQIYPDIRTLFNVNLTPVPVGGESTDKTITIPEKEME
jgi:5-hydroxyisourate hydrolase-like protein (transthyretin family)